MTHRCGACGRRLRTPLEKAMIRWRTKWGGAFLGGLLIGAWTATFLWSVMGVSV